MDIFDTGFDIFTISGDYAGLHFNGGSTAVGTDLVHSFEMVDDFDTDMPESISNGVHASDHIVAGVSGDYMIAFSLSATPAGTNKTFEFFVMEISASGSAIQSCTAATPVVVTSSAHGFVNGNKVKITGVTTADELNTRIFTVTKLTNDTYSLQEDNGGNINGTTFGAGTGGTAFLVNQFETLHSQRKFAALDIGSLSAHGIVTLTSGDAVQLYVKNISDGTDITLEAGQLSILRVG